MKNKKGVSPILATVLIIAISIALAVVAFNYMNKKATDFDPEKLSQSSVYCDSVAIGLRTDDPCICTEQNCGVKLLDRIDVVNKGSFSITQLVINVPGDPARVVFLNPTLAPGLSQRTPIQLSKASDESEIKIVPAIKDVETGEVIKCSEKELKIDDYKSLCEVDPATEDCKICT